MILWICKVGAMEEKMAYKNNLITGITELLVLKILEQQDSYVYEIQKMIYYLFLLIPFTRSPIN